MAPVKPMGSRKDKNPQTRPGVTGFEQEYNQDPGPRQDLNPDAVDDPDSLPPPLSAEKDSQARGSKAKTPRKSRSRK